MGEPKAFASLSSGLLARKGAARPAMRPQGFGQAGSGLEDLGWNDMGFEPPKPAEGAADESHDAFGAEIQPLPLRNPVAALTPVGSPVHDQQAEIADRLADCSDEGEEEDDTAEPFEAGEEPLVAALSEVQPALDEAPVFAAPVEAVIAPAKAVEAPRRAAVPSPQPSSRARSAPGSKNKAAFTLRLERERHLKLRLACAVSGRSAQQLVTDALDAFLDTMPELNSMAEKAPLTKRA